MDKQLHMIDYGYHAFFETEEVNPAHARVIARDTGQYTLITAQGETAAVLSGAMRHEMQTIDDYPAVGDWVWFDRPDMGSAAVIRGKFERRNTISRKARGTLEQEQIIAANIDTVMICMSMNEDFSIAKLERYVFAFAGINIDTVILLTKVDLAADWQDTQRQIQHKYPNLSVIGISMMQPDTYLPLYNWFSKGRTSVLVGSSGVGKSSLVNYLAGKPLMKTSGINERTGKGRHTTTTRKLLNLGNDLGVVIDSPGIRSITIWNADRGEQSFHSLSEFANACKYANCTHTKEPGCAVRKAVEDGLISQEELKSFRKLMREFAYMESKQDLSAARRRNKCIAEREAARRR